jgi:hypothetical protein
MMVSGSIVIGLPKIWSFSATGQGEFHKRTQATCLAIDKDQNFVVCYSEGSQIHVFDPKGKKSLT